jgi:hypothetical protein
MQPLSSFGANISLVTSRGPSAKSFWESLGKLNARLEELGIGDQHKPARNMNRSYL